MAEKQDNNRLERVNRQYLYKQLAKIIKEQLEKGVYKPGDRLPSMDDLAKEFSINKITVRKALQELMAEGLIFSIPAQGTYVSEVKKDEPKAANRLRTVSLISSDMIVNDIGPYHMEILNGLRQEISKHDASLVLLHTENVRTPAEILNLIKRSCADAMIYLGPQDPSVLRYLIKNGPPALLLDNNLSDINVDTVCIDNKQAGRIAMQHLLDLGHRSIYIVSGPETHPVSQERMEGVNLAISKSDFSGEIQLSINYDNFTREGGGKSTGEILKNENRPTAILYFNDEMAVGGLQTIYSSTDLIVPKDLSIISIDGTMWSRGTHPPLTSVYIPTHQMGILAIRHLFANLETDNHFPSRTFVNLELIKRASTAKLK